MKVALGYSSYPSSNNDYSLQVVLSINWLHLSFCAETKSSKMPAGTIEEEKEECHEKYVDTVSDTPE